VYGSSIAGIQPGDTVAVVGAGPVGFLTAQAARMHDPGQVLVLDMQADRLALAEKVGAVGINLEERNAAAAVDELTEGRGADVVLECVGHPSAFQSAIDVVRRGGTVSVVGMYTHESVDLQLGFMWNRSLRLVFAGKCPVQAWWGRALEAVQDGTIDPLPIISHTLPLADAPHAYELFASRQATKVVLRP
jgi:threonine dehydrogenase-like Zn-dependent dehydrogenase